MSVTVADVLKLPSLRLATVLGGHNGLNKIVSGISVLESVDPEDLNDNIFQRGQYAANELVITGFLNCIDDIDLQCANIQRLAEGGEVGLILFYVGAYLPFVDRRLIDLADQYDFVLIQMPINNVKLRYGEVISDVTECMYCDRMKDESIVAEILARMAMLPGHQRTISAVLKMLSDRLSASVVLTDSLLNILDLAAWPRGLEETIKSHSKGIFYDSFKKGETENNLLPGGRIYHETISPTVHQRMELFLIKEGIPLSQSLIEQAADSVRLSFNIWSKSHGVVVISELIRAILQDDPMKMRRLADIFRIDISTIHVMWIFSGEAAGSLQILRERAKALQEALNGCADTVFFDVYDNKLILFSSIPYSIKVIEEQIQPILAGIREKDDTVSAFRSGNLQTTAEVREAYLCYEEYLADAKKIFPKRQWFTLGDIKFAKQCHETVDHGENYVNTMITTLAALHASDDDWNPIDTLSVYLLDADMSVTRAAELLYVHKNTVKYRLNVIADRLGFRPNKMPDSIALYSAIAVQRLLR